MSRWIIASAGSLIIGGEYHGDERRGLVDPWASREENAWLRNRTFRVLGEVSLERWMVGTVSRGVTREEAERKCGGSYCYEVEVED